MIRGAYTSFTSGYQLTRIDAPNTVNMSQKFPEVQGGGSLIVAWQIRNKHVLVVGGGEVGFFLMTH